MESSIGGISKPKPTLAPKPRLTPKPFSLQKNTTIRSINAPKTVTATSKTAPQQAGKSESTSVPKPTLPTPAKQSTTPDSKPSSVSVLTKDQPKPTKESKVSPHGEDTLDSSVGKSDPAPQTAPPKETPKSIQRDDVIQTNHKAPTDIVTNSEQKDGKKKEDEISVVQKPEESGSEVSSSANPTYRRASTRNRLSVELTSKFESGGLSLPPQPSISVSTTSTKDDANKPESSAPEQSLTTSEPSNRESDEGGLKEDYVGGGSIKRRISLLFDSSSKPEVPTKREEPEMINGTGGVKARIKNWATETSSEGPKVEKKPQVVPRPRSKSFEPVTAAAAEKTPKTPPVKPPATGTSSSQAVGDLVSKVSPPEQRTETPLKTTKDAVTEDKSSERPRETSGEHIQNKSTEGDVQLRKRSLSTGHTVTDEGDSASESGQCGLKRDNVKRRSVRFGVVERDDGGPPVVLGSPSDSSEEEEEEEKEEDASEDEAEEGAAISVPVYRRVLEKKDDEVQRLEAERLKHLEFEKKRRAEEIELVRLKEEEEEREKQKKARQREEEERERERLKKEEIERQKEEWERERLKEEERQRERQKEEEMERERQMELMWQRQREEERERAKQKEERLKQDQEGREKERLKEEERLREEREKQRLREEEERAIHEHRGHRMEAKLRVEELNKEKQREEEWEKEWVKKAGRLEGEDREREKEVELMWQRQKEEDRERARQKEERLRQEEREKERIREEAEERERHRRLREQQEKEQERMRQIEMEKQREEERREEERKRQIEKERAEEMERMKHIEMEKQREEERKEEERKRQIEKERAEEMERMKRIEMEKQREEERKEEERKRQIEKERAEEMERMRQIEMEKQREEERREEERQRQIEKERAAEMERMRRIEMEEKLRIEEKRGRDLLTNTEVESSVDEPNLISFDSEDVPPESQSPYSPIAKTYKPAESPIEVVYDDFSVKQSLIKVDFDDFSVKPKRWGSQAKVETSPVIHNWAAEPVDKDKSEVLVPLDFSPCENKVPEQVEKPESPEPILAQESPEEEKEKEEQEPKEEQLIFMEVEEKEKETEREKEEETQEEEAKEDDMQETQVNNYCKNSEDKDTDALIDTKPDQQNEACEQTPEIDSPKPVPDLVTEVSTEDFDTTDFHIVAELPPFPESSTPLLDTSIQKSKADLGKRRSRSRPSRSLRAGLDPSTSTDWRTCDSTDEKQRESDSEEEQPKSKIVCSPPPTSQKVPMFPGMSPAALIAQLKKRTGGGGTGGAEESEEHKRREEKESREEVAPSPSQPSRSPRSAPHLAGAARVLPPLGGSDGGAASSPAWLKELKSKKRLSQHDAET